MKLCQNLRQKSFFQTYVLTPGPANRFRETAVLVQNEKSDNEVISITALECYRKVVRWICHLPWDFQKQLQDPQTRTLISLTELGSWRHRFNRIKVSQIRSLKRFQIKSYLLNLKSEISRINRYEYDSLSQWTNHAWLGSNWSSPTSTRVWWMSLILAKNSLEPVYYSITSSRPFSSSWWNWSCLLILVWYYRNNFLRYLFITAKRVSAELSSDVAVGRK